MTVLPPAWFTPVILNAFILLSTTLILLWALFLFGAAETQNLYRLFLALTVPVLLTLWKTLRRGPLDRSTLGILLVGCFLLANIAWQGSLESRGFVHLWVAWAAFFVFRESVQRNQAALKLAVICLLLVGGLQGLYALVQVIGGIRFEIHPDWMPGVASGTLYNRNHFAGMMNMLFPLSLGVLLAIYQKGLRSSRDRVELFSQVWILSLICGLIGFTIVLSRSRAGLASLSLGLLFVILYLRLGTGFGHIGAWKLALIVLLVVLVLGGLFGLDLLLERFGSASNQLGERLQIYRDTGRLIWDHPWLGIGPGMYVWAFRPYQSVEGRVWYDFAHNDFLQTTAEWGIPIALVFWLWVVWRLYSSVRLADQSSSPWQKGIALGCATGVLTLLAHSLVDFNLYIPTNAMIFMALLALPQSSSETRETPAEGPEVAE